MTTPFTAVVISDQLIERRTIASLEDMQRAVGGYVELINFGLDASAFVNEDGKQLELPVNRLATQLCRFRGVGLLPDDCIRGPMLVAGPPDNDGNDTDCPTDVVAVLLLLSPDRGLCVAIVKELSALRVMHVVRPGVGTGTIDNPLVADACVDSRDELDAVRLIDRARLVVAKLAERGAA